jgi:hypothetical protein
MKKVLIFAAVAETSCGRRDCGRNGGEMTAQVNSADLGLPTATSKPPFPDIVAIAIISWISK